MVYRERPRPGHASGGARRAGLLGAERAVEGLGGARRRDLAREELRGRGRVAVEVVVEPVAREEHLATRRRGGGVT